VAEVAARSSYRRGRSKRREKKKKEKEERIHHREHREREVGVRRRTVLLSPPLCFSVSFFLSSSLFFSLPCSFSVLSVVNSFFAFAVVFAVSLCALCG
jgi:hypothetical protein